MAQYRESKTPSSRGKRLDHLNVRKSENGGHIVEHHYREDGMAYHKPKEYTFSDDEGEELVQHLAKHAQIKPTHEEATEGE